MTSFSATRPHDLEETPDMGTKPLLGLIGLGIMGRPMARNLLAAGYPVIVHDLDRAAVEELVSQGAIEGSSCGQVAEAADTLITMLPDSPQVREVYLGPGGAFETMVEDLARFSIADVATTASTPA